MTTATTRYPILDWLRENAFVLTLVGMLGTSFGWYLQYQQTVEAEGRAYSLQQIEDFKSSAAQLDEITAKLFNALADGEESSGLRSSFEEAYLRHVALAEADREVLGVEDTERYLAALGVLRDEVEKADGAAGAGGRVEALANVIVVRRELSEQALQL
ncbi:hypothetical protein [Aurantiacibacter hainanensis]|uniref:hypothetical protein n=1 Tax=Aurantiacibacter hainanensis TaxID=3076114 RepID=UPI0030C777AD